MANAILIRGARQLVTLRGPSGPRRGDALNNLGIIDDGSLLIVNGVIRDVGSARRVENLAQARNAEAIEAHGRVVMPGFVDSHTHLVSGGPALEHFDRYLAGGRSPEEIQAVTASALVREVRETPTHKLRTDATAVARKSLRHGTTTLEAKSGGALNERGELKILRVLAALNTEPFEVVPTFFASGIAPECEEAPEVYVDWLCREMLPLVRQKKLAEFTDVCCDSGGLTAQQAQRILKAAKELGFAVKVHAGQFSPRRGVEMAVDLGAVSVDHLAFADERDADLLAESSTIATLLPGATFHYASRSYPAARRLIDRGAAVALASNFGAAGTPSYNMQMALSLACRKMKMTPAEAISAATINGAHALRRAHRIGSLEIGKDADLLILETSDYRETAHQFGGNLVGITMKRGRIVYNSSKAYWTPEEAASEN